MWIEKEAAENNLWGVGQGSGVNDELAHTPRQSSAKIGKSSESTGLLFCEPVPALVADIEFAGFSSDSLWDDLSGGVRSNLVCSGRQTLSTSRAYSCDALSAQPSSDDFAKISGLG